jgi:hypothetical protein
MGCGRDEKLIWGFDGKLEGKKDIATWA